MDRIEQLNLDTGERSEIDRDAEADGQLVPVDQQIAAMRRSRKRGDPLVQFVVRAIAQFDPQNGRS